MSVHRQFHGVEPETGPAACRSGKGRNVTDRTMPARPKSRPAKFLRGIEKKLHYAGLRKEPF
jgi:hypothetical protein